MIPHMSNNEIFLLTSFIMRSKIYFEFGSGGSTFLALSSKNIDKIYSVDTSKEWLDKFYGKNLEKIFIDVGPLREWGRPSDESKKENWKSYSESITKIDDNPDTVLIDGRFRVACGIKTWIKSDNNTNVLIHDFTNRPQYHVLLDLYDVIEKSETLVVMKKKKCLIDISDFYEEYKNIID